MIGLKRSLPNHHNVGCSPMLNDAEHTALLDVPSNAARTLYTIGLRPHAHSVTGASAPIHYPRLCRIVSTPNEIFKQGRQINQLLKHLINAGLVTLTDQQDIALSLRNECIILPLMIIANETHATLHTQRYRMHMQWQPDAALFIELAQIMGLLDTQYTQEQVGEFISYWMGRPDVELSAFQWTQKFVLQRKLAAQRTAMGSTHSPRTIGYQTVTQDGKIQVDDKNKAFIARYKK